MNRRQFLQRSSALAGVACLDVPTFAESLLTLGDPNLIIGIVSDIHLRGTDTNTTFIHTLEYFRSVGVDGVIIAGDMADQGLESQLKVVSDAWFKVFPDNKGQNDQHVEPLFIYGNHDVEGGSWSSTINSVGSTTAAAQNIGSRKAEIWKTYFKEDYSDIWFKTVKGYHFIGAHWHTNNIPGLEAFLQEHSQELSSELPFFYIQHPHPKDTCNCSWAWGRDDGSVTSILSNYSNCVAFSGHSHSPLNDDRDLWQGAFTSIGTSSLKYVYPMPARENTYQADTSITPPTQMANMDCTQGRQGMVMRVYDNCITFERREFVYDQPLGDNWLIPWPISLTQPLSFENRAAKADIPQFPSGTKAAVTQALGSDRYGTEQTQLTVHFPNILKKDTGVRAFDYEVQVEYQWLDVNFVTGTKRVFSPHCYMGEAQDTDEVICVYGKSEIPSNFQFRFAVRPCECFGKKGDPIYSDWMDTSTIPTAYTSSLALEKTFFKIGETINVTFKDAPVGTDAWVGIYVHDKTPGSSNKSYAYKYTQVKDGTLSFTVGAAEEYYIVLFKDGGYTECSERITFFVVNRAYDPNTFSMTTDKKVYAVGDPVKVTLKQAPYIASDWIGIYSTSVVPKNGTCPTWLYSNRINGTLTLNVSGTKNWSSALPTGLYFVGYFTSNGYTEPFERQYFVIGTPAVLKTGMTQLTTLDEPQFSYSGMSDKLSCTLSARKTGETEWTAVQTVSNESGSISTGKLEAGEWEFALCLDGTPVSKVLTITVNENDQTPVSNISASGRNDNLVYRIDGTRVDSMQPHGLYIINGEKIIK